MQKVVLITGCSSGIGLATAKLFAEKDWRVIATMRDTSKASDDLDKDSILVEKLDVTVQEDIDNIERLIQEKYNGQIDLLVNNAGYGMFGFFETISEKQIRHQYDVNVFGLMAVTRMVIPFMRARKSGCIINISSVVGKFSSPVGGIYASTKWAVEAFSEQILHELRQFGIKVKVVEPGPIETNFAGSSMKLGEKKLKEYKNTSNELKQGSGDTPSGVQGPEVVAKVIYRAATSDNGAFRYPAGRYAGTILLARKILSDRIWNFLLGKKRF